LVWGVIPSKNIQKRYKFRKEKRASIGVEGLLRGAKTQKPDL